MAASLPLPDESIYLEEYRQFRTRVAALRGAWKTFQRTGEVPEGVVEPEVLASWRRSRARGLDPYGSAYGFGGFGKIVGPIALAFFAGSSNVVSPKATIDAIIPAFVFLGTWALITGITYLFGIETKRKSIEEIDMLLRTSRT